MSKVVLDASAIIAVINNEPGIERVESALSDATVSSLNCAEVATWLTLHGMPPAEVTSTFDDFTFAVVPFDRTRAIAAGVLIEKTRGHGLSLADRACLALAIELDLPVMTGDRAWAGVDVGVKVQLIR